MCNGTTFRDTETIDRLFLELSQFTKAKTSRQLSLETQLRSVLAENKRLKAFEMDKHRMDWIEANVANIEFKENVCGNLDPVLIPATRLEIDKEIERYLRECPKSESLASDFTKCDCCYWPRMIGSEYPGLKTADGIPLMGNHHPNCPHYNDSLIDVWKVTVDGVSCYLDTEETAKEYVDEDTEAQIEQVKMHREVFENLPEFNGF